MNILKHASILLTSLLICCLSGQSNAQWAHDPNINSVVCSASDVQEYPQICNDGVGGTIIVWQDHRSGTYDIYAQRINAAGVVQWAANGIPICTAVGNQTSPQLCSDGSGGAVITWTDDRSGSIDIYAQRINASGLVQWTDDGIAIHTAASAPSHELCSDGVGGAVIAWTDLRTGTAKIYAQRINVSGLVQWAVNGIPICSTSGGQYEVQLCSDGVGGVIVAWKDSRHVFGERVNPLGIVQWQQVIVGWLGGEQSEPQLCSDGAGGAIITCQGTPPGGNFIGVYAQRFNASGVYQWTGDGAAICTLTNEEQFSPQLCSDGAAGAIVTWRRYTSGTFRGNYVQRVNGSGIVEWTMNGVAIGSVPNVQLCNDGTGGAIFVWQDQRSGTYDIYAQRINASGVAQWAMNGVPICTAMDNQTSPQLCSDGSGGAVIIWSDYRNGTNSDIYAQNIDRFGNFSSFTKIYLRDNGGAADSLEYGTAAGATDGIDTIFGEYELPPLPPTDVFDLRWKINGTLGTKLDLRDTVGGTRTQITYTGLFQPGSGGYPCTIRWNRSALPEGSFTLSDAPLGSRFSVNMKQQDSLVITDEAINSFLMNYDRRPAQKLFVSDNGGGLDSLEWGTFAGATDGIDEFIGEYELPPPPPSGVFDVRWKLTSTQGMRLDIRDTLGGTHVRATYRALMQPGPGGSPFHLQWNRFALPTGSVTLRDAPNGTRFSIDMKQQGSFTISNPEVLSFDIIYDVRPTQRIVVRDNGGGMDSLEYGTIAGATDNIDVSFGEYELPPLPPSGVFDIRWKVTGTQGSRLDIKDTLGGSHAQVTFTGMLQPGTGGYPFHLVWKRDELPAGSYILRNAPGGTLLLVDMKQQDSVTITNTNIASFQIIHDFNVTRHYSTQSAWNLLSVPLTVTDGRKSWLFPTASSNAYAFSPTGYVVRDTLKNRLGYWLRFPSIQDVPITGAERLTDTITVITGWNLIGTISDSVAVTSIHQIPPTIVASQFYGYGAGYIPSTTLLSSRGYWVKTIAPGQLILSSALAKQASPPSTELAGILTISDANARQSLYFSSRVSENDLSYYDLPPLPPSGVFDARYSTNRMLEAVKEAESRTIPIHLSYPQYPLSINWDMQDQSVTASLLVGDIEMPMNGNGSTIVSDQNLQLALKLGGWSSLPKVFALSQNYPNPFNPSTTIKYDLPKDTRVSLTLFNILGQKVLLLVNEEQKAGYKSVAWNASTFASGVYFYRMEAGDFVQTRKLLLLK